MSPPAGAAELLDVACEAALAAGRLLRERFESGPERHVRSKSTPTDPVSDADLEAQHAIRAVLSLRRPDDAFLGEEEHAEDSGSSGLRWVVDPLDGTVNYIYGIPQWCVSVAVLDELGALAAVVYDPIRPDTFTAVRGEAGHHNGRQLAALGEREVPLERALVATGFAYDAALRARQGDLAARLLPRVRDIRRFGSAALDLAWTAVGRYDAYYERGVKLWDIAAGVLLCESAGLSVRELEGGGVLVAPPSLEPALAELVITA